MNYTITINSANTVEAISEYWSEEDYVNLLLKFNYPDAENAPKDTLEELLLMAITDYEPNEAAAIILEYKLADKINEGQISQISNDMLLDKISEEYPDISLHAPLFHINQLLYKAFNGKFPNAKATQINLSITPLDQAEEPDFTKENILRLLDKGLADSNLIKRLFSEQMAGSKPFPEAENIIWELEAINNRDYSILTSDYWLSKTDIVAGEFEGVLEQATDSVEMNSREL
ncbi:hypothetical protein DXT99_08155 [Pontibacter diazotrophicus]|uniref:Uncharacterized protein n=1 Tax=Pontibacter diazotrophicus TaxID=1400979 RepID=A0A3D8LDH6_9BACT|nr:hypothetical protein [Pontibacter diazotrophicus]RDV15458.1 hypothetical protein DXT99_08155 [Pontibacter diazotrophicus]